MSQERAREALDKARESLDKADELLSQMQPFNWDTRTDKNRLLFELAKAEIRLSEGYLHAAAHHPACQACPAVVTSLD